jgi:hypothetical protein
MDVRDMSIGEAQIHETSLRILIGSITPANPRFDEIWEEYKTVCRRIALHKLALQNGKV